MVRLSRCLRAEGGVAMITVMLAIFILTVVVSALAIATMGESTLSYDQLRGQQALAVAEAGAYRALAELRRRVHVDLDARLSNESSVDPTNTTIKVHNICENSGTPPRLPIQIITDYAFPQGLPVSDWTLTGPDGATAVLNIGTAGSPIQMSVGGQPQGEFYATIAVRSSGRLSPGTDCLYGGTVPEQLVMWFDYAILAVGRTGNATRTVCLRSAFADRCPDWFPAATATPTGSYTATGGTYNGWPVIVEKAAYSRWALMLLDVGSVWLYTGTTINGPVHSNTHIRIAGNPQINDQVTQVQSNMVFFNCGSPTTIAIPASNPNGTLRTSCTGGPPGAANGDNTSGSVFGSTVVGGATPVPLPTNANPSRTSIGLSPSGPDAVAAQVSAATSDNDAGNPWGIPPGTLPPGVYIADSCGTPTCGGIYVNGDVQQMVLASESDRQVIRISVLSDPVPERQNMKIIIDPITKSVTTCWGLSGADPGLGDCTGWSGSRTYPAGTFNGILYVDGSIQSAFDPSNPNASSGLYGTVNRNMRLTIAAEGEIRITDQLVYEAPPAGPGHNPNNVLGLYSVTGDVTIHGRAAPNDLYIDAVVLSPTGKFWVEEYNALPVKGNIYTLGGTVQGTFGAFGTFSPPAGYGRVMTYDWRLRSNVSPPFFPVTDIYTAVRYPSPSPLFANGDPLYDRPQWEEMVGL